jgi:hypothetical protein
MSVARGTLTGTVLSMKQMPVGYSRRKLLNQNTEDIEERLVKSTARVRDHGEVFTPSWMVEDMLDLVKTESERIDSRFLEPACGSGNFLTSVLRRKLATVQSRYGKSEFERRHHALFALMCIYGIELLKDNVEECRESLLAIYAEYLKVNTDDVWAKAAAVVLNANIIQGDALTLTTTDGKAIEFPEWGYLGAGKFQRRDFRYDALTQRSSIEGTLFEMLEEHELFIPTKTYAQMTVEEIAQ